MIMRIGPWAVGLESTELTISRESFSGVLQGGFALKSGERTFALDEKWEIREMENGLCFTLPHLLTMELRFHLLSSTDWLLLAGKVTNLSREALQLQSVELFSGWLGGGEEKWGLVYRHGKDLCDYSALQPLEGETVVSHGLASLTRKTGERAFTLGFLEQDVFFGEFAVQAEKNGVGVQARLNLEGKTLEAGASLPLPGLLLQCEGGLSSHLQEYGAQVAGVMSARVGPVQTGWCSWYYYYGKESEQDILDNVRAIQMGPLARDIRVIQIDDGWNLPEPDSPCVWGDWMPGAKFPRGMKAVADDIRAAGYVPGLWLAPFSVTGDSTLAKEHPDWLVQKEGKPAVFWERHGLDLTHPEALEFVRETFDRVFNEWGYDYVKIDFLMHALQEGERKAPGQTPVKAYRRGMEVIREVAGDRFVLACGAPMGPTIGLCDAMRIGYDVSSRWSVPANLQAWPAGNCNVKAAAVQTIWRQWMHLQWWQNDPDCILIRDYASEPEIALFSDAFGGAFKEMPPYGLSEEEAECWVKLVWFTGGMALVSENMMELQGKRLEMLTRSFPLNPAPGQLVDWYPHPEVTVLENEKGDIGLFNLSDKPVTLEVPRSRFQNAREGTYREDWRGDHLELKGNTFTFPELPGHGGRIWLRC